MITGHFLKSAMLLMLGFTMTGYSQTDALSRAETTVPELPGLTIVECVKVLSFKTGYQVNLELREYDPQPQYRLDLIGLQNQPIDQVLTNLLSQTGDYVFLKTNKTINVVPKNQRNSTNYVFNTILPEYDVKEQNLVGAWEPLCHKAPQLVLVFPVTVGSESSPKWIADEKTDTRAGPTFSLSLHNASVRTVLNEMASKNEDSFWIAQPSGPPKWQWISIFRRDYGKDVLWKHDPGLREQMRQLWEKRGAPSPY